jgi:hypothetical protein
MLVPMVIFELSPENHAKIEVRKLVTNTEHTLSEMLQHGEDHAPLGAGMVLPQGRPMDLPPGELTLEEDVEQDSASSEGPTDTADGNDEGETTIATNERELKVHANERETVTDADEGKAASAPEDTQSTTTGSLLNNVCASSSEEVSKVANSRISGLRLRNIFSDSASEDWGEALDAGIGYLCSVRKAHKAAGNANAGELQRLGLLLMCKQQWAAATEVLNEALQIDGFNFKTKRFLNYAKEGVTGDVKLGAADLEGAESLFR